MPLQHLNLQYKVQYFKTDPPLPPAFTVEKCLLQRKQLQGRPLYTHEIPTDNIVLFYILSSCSGYCTLSFISLYCVL